MNDDNRILVTETYMQPTAEYPKGSYLYMIGGRVEVATGYYETLYPGHPSLHWHGGAPFVVMDFKHER